jgi:formylglycine-generating enzyme required for sulfatase activity
MIDKYKNDVFISHATEDKEIVARPLYQKLKDKGYNAWFDEVSLTLGDSLSKKIAEGLLESRFIIIVFSPSFAEKAWTNHEYKGAVQRKIRYEKEKTGNVVILPIWHGVSSQEVEKFDPTFADLVATNFSKGIDNVINDIVGALTKAGINPKQIYLPNLEVFKFETVKLYIEGNSIRSVTLPHQANYFIEDLESGVTLKMIEIPGGTFMMGASTNEEGSRDNERPMHQVTVKPFFMGKYLITQEQWDRVASSFPKVNRELDPRPSNFRGNGCLPVEQVSWLDAVEFCDRLAKKTSRNYRLPSEAEWEYACRSGTTTPFHFGNTITSDVANYIGNITYNNVPEGVYRRKTTPVESFLPNAFGLYDMHGNLFEWCEDFRHKSYEGVPTDGSAWLKDNDNPFRVLRGGSWSESPDKCRSAYRTFYYPDHKDKEYGFRVVCSGAF